MKRTGVPFDQLCVLSGLPAPMAEYRFDAHGHPPRRWRWDFCWPDLTGGVALEVNGAIFTQGKHSRGAGQMNDFEKWSEGAAQGWRVLHVTPEQLESTATFDWIRRALASTQGE